jgi:copper transporter 1
MDLLARHDMGGMHMGGSSTTMDMMMSSTTMAMSMASSTGMGGMDMGGMDMGGNSSMGGHMHMDMPGMNMWLTTHYKKYPVVFKTLKANTGAQGFGIFVLLFVLAFVLRGAEFYRLYLEQRVWQNPMYLGSCGPDELAAVKSGAKPAGDCCSPTSGSSHKDESDIERAQEPAEGAAAATYQPHRLRLALSLVRDAIRIFLNMLQEMFAYGLMLAAMTFCLVYFFAIVTGLALGRFFFEKLSFRMGLKAVTSGIGGGCCN